VGSTDPNSRTVADAYLALINVLSCVEEGQAWILSDTRVDGSDGTTDRSTKRAKLEGTRSSTHQRQVLTLADIKAEYQTEVERVGLLLNGGFFV
jgi:nuclear pore complex protein Nup160